MSKKTRYERQLMTSAAEAFDQLVSPADDLTGQHAKLEGFQTALHALVDDAAREGLGPGTMATELRKEASRLLEKLQKQLSRRLGTPKQ